MPVNKIQPNRYNHSPNFGALIVTESGAKSLKKHLNVDELKQIVQWKNRLSETKHFDLEISDFMDDIFLKFRHKTNPHFSSEAPLRTKAPKDNYLEARGIDLLDCGDCVYYDLRFPSKKEAVDAYEILNSFEQSFNEPGKDLFRRIHQAVESTHILDRSFEYMEQNPALKGVAKVLTAPLDAKTIASNPSAKPVNSQKQSLLQRLKNAWQALKYNQTL